MLSKADTEFSTGLPQGTRCCAPVRGDTVKAWPVDNVTSDRQQHCSIEDFTCGHLNYFWKKNKPRTILRCGMGNILNDYEVNCVHVPIMLHYD